MNWSDVVVVIVAGGIGQAIIAPPGNPDPQQAARTMRCSSTQGGWAGGWI